VGDKNFIATSGGLVNESSTTTATFANVTGLPGIGETLYVRLYSLINGAWQAVDYTIRHSNAAEEKSNYS
jgi:hypothetical protein